jgi:hypothetical protein
VAARKGARAARGGRRKPPDLVERAADELYGLPLEQFVARRNELAKSLRAEGNRDAAGAVAELRKPTVAAWTANQLARRQELDVRRLLKAGEALRSGKRRGAESFREARAEESDVIRRLLAAAHDLEPAPSDATLASVASLLRSAALDESAAEQLAKGRLTGDVEPTDSFALLAAGLPETAPARKDDAPRPAARRKAAQALAEAEKAERDLARAEERVAAAEAALREAKKDAADRRKQAKEARKRAERSQVE